MISSNMKLRELLEYSELDNSTRQQATDLLSSAAALLDSREDSKALASTAANLAALFLHSRFFADSETPRSPQWQERARALVKQATILSGALEVMAGESPAWQTEQDCQTSGQLCPSARHSSIDLAA